MLVLALILLAGLFTGETTSANTLVKGTFENVTYDEVWIDENTTEKRLKSITIANHDGQMITLNIDRFALLSINTLPVTIDAFKKGMEVEADVNLRRVKALRGKSGTSQGNIDYGSRVAAGTINRVDEAGKFLSIRLDDGQTKKYYINEGTSIFKDTTLVDIGELYEGDRVKLTFSEYDTNTISEIKVNVQGVIIEGLYKGKLQRIEPIGNRIMIKDEMMFRNWKWDRDHTRNRSYTFSPKTPIYLGDKQIPPHKLRYYKDHDVYYVTVNHFGKQVIEKMVIKESNERTFNEQVTAVNPTQNWIHLRNVGKINYHDGTILIRNGRLVDTNSLLYSGTAFVVTEGGQKSEYADVIHLANDGMEGPSLTNHSIYYGKINRTGTYNLTLNNAKLLFNHYWKEADSPNLTFSNDTIVVRDSRGSVLTVLPKNEMDDYVGEYGYFYVKDNHITAVHLLGTTAYPAELVSVGRMDGIGNDSIYYERNNPEIIHVRNVSQWRNGVWNETGKISNMNIKQATIIRDGQVISAEELKIGDRLFIVHESDVKGRFIFVD